MFPRLDVDFHLAPFVDPRDHFGVAAARVTIGAPHFETPREFWVRPVRWVDSKDFAYANLLMRPVEAEKARLIIANFAFKHPPEQEHLEIPANWLEGRINNHNGQAHTLFSSCSRFWHEPERDVRVAWQGFKNPVFCEGVTLHLNLKWLPNPYAEPRRFLLDEFVDWPTTEFHDFLRYQLNDTSSQLCLTWKWSHLSRGEQRRLFFALPRWKKLPVLLKSVLQNEAIFNPLIAQSGADINLYSS